MGKRILIITVFILSQLPRSGVMLIKTRKRLPSGSLFECTDLSIIIHSNYQKNINRI